MDDLISRKDAIRIASGHCHPSNIAKELAELPSAQPEIIRCKDCKRYGQDNCFMKIQMLWELEPNDFCSYAERRGEEDETDRC